MPAIVAADAVAVAVAVVDAINVDAIHEEKSCDTDDDYDDDMFELIQIDHSFNFPLPPK
jgi:hypothetical protein